MGPSLSAEPPLPLKPAGPESEDAKAHRLGRVHGALCELLDDATVAEILSLLGVAIQDRADCTGVELTEEIAIVDAAHVEAKKLGEVWVPALESCGTCASFAPLVPDPFGGKPICERCRDRFGASACEG